MFIKLVDSDRAIFLQIADAIEDCILRGVLDEQAQAPSTIEIAVANKINTATANKGVNTLVEQGILYKKRGIGMFVAVGAKQMIAAKRAKAFATTHVQQFCTEASKLDIPLCDLLDMIKANYPSQKK